MRIKVTGYIDIDAEEHDPGPKGPLTEAAYNEWCAALGLDDIDFEVDD
jgi:hypothetical protein